MIVFGIRILFALNESQSKGLIVRTLVLGGMRTKVLTTNQF
jgi:hypothetical protein